MFFDEIHRLSPVVEEVLYPGLEAVELDIVMSKGPAARPIRLDLQLQPLVGATTRAGAPTSPFHDRFGIVDRLDFYSRHELSSIVRRSAGIVKVATDDGSALEIPRRARGTPRIANRLLRRVRD